MPKRKQPSAIRVASEPRRVTRETAPAAPQPPLRERRWILALAAFAAARVLSSAAVFPFLNNVDELAHYDLVLKYARGTLPHELAPYSQELAEEYTPSPEFRNRPENFGGSFPDPPKTAAEIAAKLEWTKTWARQHVNKESAEPPLYYALAAAWLWIGRGLGIAGIHLLYWIRALDALPAALLVCLGYATSRLVFPQSGFHRLGVPVLLAVYPQNTFYSIAPDMLSPLFFGLGFLGVLRFGAVVRRPAVAGATGLALAAAALVKLCNLPLAMVAGADLLWRARDLGRERGARAVLPALGLLLACAALPVAAWLAWNRLTLGNWTGTAAKVAELSWTAKSLSDWWPHPLFTPAGLYVFWSGLLETFWRGEVFWHDVQLGHRCMDVFYWSSSALLPLVALFRLPPEREARAALGLAAACWASGVVFMATLSLAFDFGESQYPSQAHPFFTSGRLISGALVPFLLLYMYGLDRALAFASERTRWLALGGIACAVTVSELLLDLGPLASHYNVFHLA